MSRIITAVLLGLALTLGTAPPAGADPGDPQLPRPAAAPSPGPVVRAFDPPEQDWKPGHRGVDLGVTPGTVIRAAAAGTVTFSGTLAGRGVVVVDHGHVRTTYEPLDPGVHHGQSVDLGQALGTVVAGHPGCPATACLHWGLRRGESYLDPLSLLTRSTGDVRLLPADAFGRLRARRADRGLHPPIGGSGTLLPPVRGQVTSPFGMRIDPIKGTWRLHSGTDFGAPCGAPLVAAASGVVTTVTWHPSYGNRLVIDHGVVGGRALRTAYNHASGYSARVGERVAAGQPIGSVGTTGDSTGCHLHFMVYSDGRVVDPMGLLGARP
jgi:murein DD-endopeptidase MepM/ murein hydrolase activator NlpD